MNAVLEEKVAQFIAETNAAKAVQEKRHEIVAEIDAEIEKLQALRRSISKRRRKKASAAGQP